MNSHHTTEHLAWRFAFVSQATRLQGISEKDSISSRRVWYRNDFMCNVCAQKIPSGFGSTSVGITTKPSNTDRLGCAAPNSGPLSSIIAAVSEHHWQQPRLGTMHP